MLISNKNNIATYRCCECTKTFKVLNATSGRSMYYLSGYCCSGRIAGVVTRKRNWFFNERIEWVLVELTLDVMRNVIVDLILNGSIAIDADEELIDTVANKYFSTLKEKKVLMNVSSFTKYFPNSIRR